MLEKEYIAQSACLNKQYQKAYVRNGKDKKFVHNS